jgi:hypothetical protein
MINIKLINSTYYKNSLENLVMQISSDTKYTKYIIGQRSNFLSLNSNSSVGEPSSHNVSSNGCSS